ncbi:MAG TPA: ABC transporter permease subunit [Caldimonas sp.]|nr:ABC transporter permease subunit [Caldimonas sp.]
MIRPGRSGWPRGRAAVIGVPYVWLLVFFLLPFLVVAKISFSEMETTSVASIVSWHDGGIHFNAHLDTYLQLVRDDLYLRTYAASLKYAAVTTLLCLVIGYPFAYFMARARRTLQPALLMLVMLPFWTSFLLRVYAWKALLTGHGLAANAIEATGFDKVLAAAGMIPGPGQLMNTPFSLVLGMTYAYLPFMILPLYSNLAKMDLRLLEAASDLGASAWTAFWTVTVPLSRAGIIAGTMLVFIPCVGEYVIPELLGGPATQMIGRTLWDEFFSNNDWPMACTVAVAMILFVIVPIAIFSRYQSEATDRRAPA